MVDTLTCKKTGLLGGSFDPVHTGHLLIARDAMEELDLEEIFFIPAAQAPLRVNSPQASALHRKAMLMAAIGGEPNYHLLDFELDTGGTSYTIDTARALTQKHPNRRFFWILGEDQLSKLSQWKNIDELCKLIEFVALDRPGHTSYEKPSIPGLHCHRLCGHIFSISSSEIRERLKNQQSVREFLPEKVHQYIVEKEIYKN